MKFSDETLLAYLEGNLDEAEASAIENAIEADPELEQRLMALDPFAPVVQSVFERVPSETPVVDLPDPAVEVAVRSAGGGLRLLAVAASVAVIAVSATFWATRPQPMGWAEQAAIYQSLYVPDTIASLDSSPQALDVQFALAEEQLGRSLNRAELEALPGLQLKRAQVLSFKGKPLVQVVFADEDGRPFAFCVIRQGEGAPAKDVKQAVLSGLATATWAQDGYGYMLIGSNGQTDLSGQLDFLKTSFAS
jgi:anti-sigma factor RsiW